MTRDETINILRKFKSAYRNFYKDLTELEAKDMIDLWEIMFADIDSKSVGLAIMNLIATKKDFPPSIAEILEVISNSDKNLTGGQAWQETITAMRNYGYYKAVDGIKSLSPMTQEVIKQMGGFAELCKSENPELNRAHFLKIFESLIEQTKEKKQIPKCLQIGCETSSCKLSFLTES